MFEPDRSERGAVSIFFIVIFAAVFAFVAIFIDFARMFALQAKSEALAHAASRSVMSSFDQKLVEKYGLFAYGETDENYIMSKVLNEQFELVRRSDDLPLLGAKLDSSSVELLKPIGRYSVFERQINEQMKYRAPIDLTIEILNRFKPMSQVMKEASNTVDLLGKLQKLYEQREAKLDEMLEKQRQAAKLIEPFSSLLPRSVSFIGDQSLGGTISTAADAVGQYADYERKVEEDMQRDLLDRLYSLEISEYRSGASEVFDDLSRYSRAAEEQHGQLLKQAGELLEEARQINEQMRRTIEEAEQREAQNGYNEVAAGPSTKGANQVGSSGEIAKIREKSTSILLPEALFADLAKDIAGQGTAYGRFQTEISSLLSQQGAVLSAAAYVDSFKSAVTRSSREADAYLRQYSDHGPANVINANASKLEAPRAYDKERKATERAAKAKLTEATGLLKQISQMQDQLKSYQDQFDQLNTFYEENRAKNKGASGGELGPTVSGSDPYQAGDSAMKGMDALYGGLSEFMNGMSDNVFQSEYIVSHYKLFDINALEALVKGTGSQAAEGQSLIDKFAPGNQEVEYILYGINNPGGNIAAAFGEIFTMRLAIRTMEGLIKNGNKGHPLLVLAAALLYGVEHALKDMLTLIHEGKIMLSDYLKVELTYRDHLRMFLLLHGKSDGRLSRMLAVIRKNTGINTDERATYMRGKVSVAMPIWFLPGVAKMIGASGVLKGKVEGSRYYAVKQADFSY